MCEFKNQEMLTYSVENFLFGDYNKGPSETGETTYLPVLGFGTDKLAPPALWPDTWEVPDPLTYSFHLRPGVKWQNKFPHLRQGSHSRRAGNRNEPHQGLPLAQARLPSWIRMTPLRATIPMATECWIRLPITPTSRSRSGAMSSRGVPI